VSFPPFQPLFPWYGPHLQSIRNPLSRPQRLAGGDGIALRLPLRDGDVLSARLDRPPSPRPGLPAILLVHGLGGCETSIYVLAASAFFTALGHDVVRLSLRGAGPSQPLCRGWSHAGRFADLEDAVAALDLDATGLVLVGFSLGGNLALNYLAHGAPDPRIVAGVSVSAPIDMTAASDLVHRPRNRLYHDYLLRALKQAYLNRHSSLSEAERRGVATARTLFAVDDEFTAPHHGFAGALDYYRRVSAAPHIATITRPTLLLHAVDDPFIPVASYHALPPAAAVTVALAGGGGHLGFHDRRGPWHLLAIARFLDKLRTLA
jgi:uncharacterized protein